MSSETEPIYGLEESPSIYEVFDHGRPRAIGEPVRVTEEVYFYFLNVMPPIWCRGGGFMVCEPDSDQENGTVYSKFTETANGFFHEWALVPWRSA